MNTRKIGITLLLLIIVISFTSGCSTQSPEGIHDENTSAPELVTTAPDLPFTVTTQSTLPPTTGTPPTPPVTDSVSNPLLLNESYRCTSGENEIIIRFAAYDLTDNYGEPSMRITNIYPHKPGPDTIFHAPVGKKFLFLYFTFFNMGDTSAEMPGPEIFSIIRADGTSFSPTSSIPGGVNHVIVQVNGTRKNMNEYATAFVKYGLPAGFHYAPGTTWYIPFIVPDTFDPAKSYVSVKFNDRSNAVWKFN